MRIIAASLPPLLNAQSKDGGIVLKILTSALESSGMRVSVQWADSEKAALSELFAGKSADIALFMQTTYCDSPSNQSVIEAQDLATWRF